MRAETMKCVVRIARKKDVYAIAALDRLANTNHDTEKTWKFRISRAQESLVYVACVPETGEVIGYAFALLVGSYKRLMDVNVLETLRRRGIGSQLMDVILACPGGLGTDAILASENNEPAVAFFREHGFRVCRNMQYIPDLVRYIWQPDSPDE